MNQNQLDNATAPRPVDQQQACSVAYLEGALAKAKTWSVHNSPYAHHLPDHKEWLRGYADYPQKFCPPNDQDQTTPPKP